MDDESIIALYWQRDQRAITETDTKASSLSSTRRAGSLPLPAVHSSSSPPRFTRQICGHAAGRSADTEPADGLGRRRRAILRPF